MNWGWLLMDKWKQSAQYVKAETKEALRTIYDALNQGQQQKLMKDENVKALFERYVVSV